MQRLVKNVTFKSDVFYEVVFLKNDGSGRYDAVMYGTVRYVAVTLVR